MSFTRTKENFTCEVCSREVVGNGYTNHCPHCLWSKHVDIDPGDRRATCGGRMQPISVHIVHGEEVITHVCVQCAHTRRQRAAHGDARGVLLSIVRDMAEK